MKKNFKTLLVFCAICSTIIPCEAQTKHISIGIHEIKEWTNFQHQKLSSDLCLMIDSGKLIPVNINKDSAIKLLNFQTKNNSDNKDSLSPILTDLKTLLITKQNGNISVQSTQNAVPVIFNESDWNKFIFSNESRQLFWHFFFDDIYLNSESFSHKTEELIKQLLVKLITDINKGEEVFKDQQFTQAIDKSVDLPAKALIIMYISTDSDDPTIGYDSTYTVDAMQNILKENTFSELKFILTTKNLKTQVAGMGFNTLYIKHNAIISYNAFEKRLMNVLIGFVLSNW
ncbi:MAG TPA: hypothetical protein VGF79_04210 [Bacteroidia bacterium]